MSNYLEKERVMYEQLDNRDGYTVFKVRSPKHVKQTSDTFIYFMENWYNDIRNYIKEYQTLVLDKHLLPLYLISYEPSGNLNAKEIHKIFDIAKSLPRASKLIVGRNNPGKPTTPDEKELEIATTIDEISHEYDMTVLNQVLLSADTMYYFKTAGHVKHQDHKRRVEAKRTHISSANTPDFKHL